MEPEQIHLAIKEREYWSKVRRACRMYGKAVNIETERGVISRARQNRRSTSPIFSTMTLPSALARRVRVEPTRAVAAAVDALERQEIRRILLTRPGGRSR